MTHITPGLYVPEVPGVPRRDVIDVANDVVVYALHGSCALRLEATHQEFAAWIKLTRAREWF